MAGDYYADMAEWRSRIEAVLEGTGFTLGLVWTMLGSVSVIWYWGESETGFAHGRTPEEIAANAMQYIFGGL